MDLSCLFQGIHEILLFTVCFLWYREIGSFKWLEKYFLSQTYLRFREVLKPYHTFLGIKKFEIYNSAYRYKIQKIRLRTLFRDSTYFLLLVKLYRMKLRFPGIFIWKVNTGVYFYTVWQIDPSWMWCVKCMWCCIGALWNKW